MGTFRRWSILALFALVSLTGSAGAAGPFFRFPPRYRPVQPIPNVTTTRAFFNPQTGRVSFYVPPNLNPLSGSNHPFGLVVSPGPTFHSLPARPPIVVTGSGGYGGGPPMPMPMPMTYPVPQQATTAAPTYPAQPAASPLDALGVPNQAGRLLWPLGLRIVPPALETKPLLQQVEIQLVQLATQAAGGEVDADLVRQARASVARLRHFLTEGETRMAQVTATEAKQFLNALETTIERVAQ